MEKKKLKDYRIDAGKSKMQFAKDLEIPYTTYLRYEADLQKAPVSEVAKICNKVHIEIQQIEC